MENKFFASDVEGNEEAPDTEPTPEQIETEAEESDDDDDDEDTSDEDDAPDA